MLSIERTQSQTDYKESEFKQKLSKTRSCPTKTRRSQSSIRSNSSFVPKLPPNFRNGSTGRPTITSLSSKDLELNAIESSTSSSVFHGIILVSIMLSSLIAFVCSKIKRPCDPSSPHMYDPDCKMSVVLFFSVITIISCLISFIIYFLHLIGQCDAQWIVKKKITIEIVVISAIVLLLITANTYMVMKTRILDNWVGITSILCSSLSIIGYAIRITKLCNESKGFAKREIIEQNECKIDETALTLMKEKLKNKLNCDSNKSWEINGGLRHSTPQNCGSALRVVSYVKRKKSLDSNPKSISQNNNNNTNSSADDMDLEDDVFIN